MKHRWAQTGPDEHAAPDGTPVGLYLALGTEGEPELIHGAIPSGAEILELGSGCGRITHRLIELGHPVVAVDESAEMLASVRGAETVLARIEDLELGRTFPCVLLMSNLVNTVDLQRHAFLQTCRRHVADDGIILIERLDPSARSGLFESTYSGIRVVVERKRRGRHVSGVVTYEHPDGRRWTHRFVGARLLDDDEMRDELTRAGLRLRRWLDPKRRWCAARPA